MPLLEAESEGGTEALTAKQGLWTYLMDPRQRHGEMRVLCGSMLGS